MEAALFHAERQTDRHRIMPNNEDMSVVYGTAMAHEQMRGR